MRTFNRQNKGSILIWTVMLGAILTSVFFFLAMRLRSNLTTQNELIEYQSGKAYVESYADYLVAQGTPAAPLPNIQFPSETNPEITGSLTKILSSIEGVLDSGKTVTLTSSNTLCWGKTGTSEPNDLLIDGAPVTPDADTCPGYQFKKSGAGTAQAITPVHYKIDGGIADTEWHLNLDLNLSYGKKIHAYRAFSSTP